MATKKDALQKSGKIPGYPKPGKKKTPVALQVDTSQIINKLHPKELKQILGKSTYPVTLDFSASCFQLEDDDFLATCPNIVKEFVQNFCPLNIL